MTFADSVADAATAGLCAVLDTVEKSTNFFRNLINRQSYRVIGGAVVPRTQIAPATFASRTLCNREPPPPEAPTFAGGQCDGVLYKVKYTWTLDGGLPDDRENEQYGPIIGFSSPRAIPGNDRVRVVNITARGPAGAAPSSEPRTYQFSSIGIGSREGASFQIRSIERADGQPDQCGNPPSGVVLPPPEGYNRRTVPNFTYVNNEGTTINLGDLNLVYLQPTIDIDGRITVPVNVDVGGLNFGLGIDLDGTVNFNFGEQGRRGGGGDGADDPEIDEEPPSPPPSVPGLPPPVEDDPAAEKVIIGALITVTEITSPVPTQIFQDDNPDIFAPNLGYVQFLIKVSGIVGGWSEDIPVKNRRQIIACPWRYGAIDVRGTARMGVNLTITPIYKDTLVRREPELLPPVIA